MYQYWFISYGKYPLLIQDFNNRENQKHSLLASYFFYKSKIMLKLKSLLKNT